MRVESSGINEDAERRQLVGGVAQADMPTRVKHQLVLMLLAVPSAFVVRMCEDLPDCCSMSISIDESSC